MTTLPARVAAAVSRVQSTRRPRAVAVAADLAGLARAVERCERSG